MSGVHITKAGVWTSQQHSGRHGMQQYGIGPGGAMDPIAFRTANLLVGNDGDEDVLEMTAIGPALVLGEDALVAICGADMQPTVLGEQLPLNRPIFLRAGTELLFGAVREGYRTYLAVAGGFKSWELEFRTKRLSAGEALLIGTPSTLASAYIEGMKAAHRREAAPTYLAPRWSVAATNASHQSNVILIRVIPGREAAQLTADSRRALFEHAFTVSTQSDRMGYRLAGPQLHLEHRVEMMSEPVSCGTVQLPPSGDPIVLMADCQTTGGYPRIAHVITADLTLLAQAAPGSSILFVPVTQAEAEQLYGRYRRQLRILAAVIHNQLSRTWE